MTDARTRKYRGRKYGAQHHTCFYCAFPMWTQAPADFAHKYCISVREALRFRCTAEHLRARCDGGTSRVDNIVAACWFCNSQRHHRKKPPQPDTYRAFIQRRLARQSWHPPWLHKMLAQAATA